MIETLENFPGNVVAVARHGHVTKRGYATVLVPAVGKALRAHDKVRLYYAPAAGFAG